MPMVIIQNLISVTVVLTLWLVDDCKQFQWLLSNIVRIYLNIYVLGFVSRFVLKYIIT